MKILKCKNPNCNKEIKGKGKTGLCRSCAQKGEKAKNYKDGRTLKQYFCSCGKEICYHTALYGSGLCISCCQIKHGNYCKGKRFYCKKCGKKITYSKKGFSLCISCSRKGKKRTKQQKENISGKNNPNWKSGISFEPYPLEWTKTLRESIRQRDNYTCQYCGEKQTTRKLEVHHIDYNKNNLNPDNLISLCIKCHRITNGNRDYHYALCTYKMENKKCLN